MKRYIIEFNKDDESSYTPRTVYVPCGEPVQLLFTVKGETGNQIAGFITVKDANGTESKTEDADTINFTVPQTTNTYAVSCFTFENGITYDTTINGSISLNGGVSLVFSNVLVKPVPPESISYVGGGGGGGSDIECESLTATNQMDRSTATISGGDVTVSDGYTEGYNASLTLNGLSVYSPIAGSTTTVDAYGITIGSYTLDETSLQALLALIQN